LYGWLIVINYAGRYAATYQVKMKILNSTQILIPADMVKDYSGSVYCNCE